MRSVDLPALIPHAGMDMFPACPSLGLLYTSCADQHPILFLSTASLDHESGPTLPYLSCRRRLVPSTLLLREHKR